MEIKNYFQTGIYLLLISFAVWILFGNYDIIIGVSIGLVIGYIYLLMIIVKVDTLIHRTLNNGVPKKLFLSSGIRLLFVTVVFIIVIRINENLILYVFIGFMNIKISIYYNRFFRKDVN